MLDELSARLDAAAEAATLAGKLAQALRVQGLQVAEKGAQDFVTQADRAAEDLIRSHLARRFPDDGFLGEEGGHHAGGRGVWVVDPIDGTTNFSVGSDYWCVSIAWVCDQSLQLGVLCAPDRGELFTARAGGGAYRNGRRLPSLAKATPSRALVSVGKSPHTPAAVHGAVITRLLEGGYEYRRYGSAALSTAAVATGRLHGFAEVRINSWDILAALLLVHETGGCCSDFLAAGGLLKPHAVLATAPGLYQDLLQRLELPAMQQMPEQDVEAA